MPGFIPPYPASATNTPVTIAVPANTVVIDSLNLPPQPSPPVPAPKAPDPRLRARAQAARKARRKNRRP